jgi:hypothetical protein
LARVYVAAEFVFSGSQAQTIRVRSIKYTAAVVKILPQLAFGGGWYSALYFTNTGDSEASLQVSFIGNDGKPLRVESIAGSAVTVNLAPRGMALIEAPNAGALQQGYVSVLLPSSVVGYGIFRSSAAGVPDQEAVVPLSGASATTCTLIWDDTNFVTAVAIVNPSPVDAIVTVTVRDPSGAFIGTSSVTLAAGNKTAVALRNLPGLERMPGNRGSADFVASSGSLAVLGLRFGVQAFTSIPTADR